MAAVSRICRSLCLAAGLVALSSGAAWAHDGGPRGEWRNGSWYPDQPAPPVVGADYAHGYDNGGPGYDPASQAWLADCRRRLSSRDRGLGGAAIGAVVGGVAGNRIAGRGNRTIGTVAGAGVGAVAGSAIDRAEDRSRNADECEAYLADYQGYYSQSQAPAPYPQAPGYPAYGYPAYPGYAPSYAPAYYAPAPGCCAAAVPVVQPTPNCTETVEYVYEYVPARSHPRRLRTKVVADKRVKIVPDKRVRIK